MTRYYIKPTYGGRKVAKRINEGINFRGIEDGYYDMPTNSTIDDLAKEVRKDFDYAKRNGANIYDIDNYMTSMTKSIVNGFSIEDFIKALSLNGLYVKTDKCREKLEDLRKYCLNDLYASMRDYHKAWAEDMLSSDGFAYDE